MPGFLSPGKGVPLLLIPEYSGINKGQRVPDRSKTAHRKPFVKCFQTVVIVQLLSHVQFFVTQWAEARQAPPSPGIYSNSCPLSQGCHATIPSVVIPFSSCLQSFPASGCQLFTSGGWCTGASALVLPMNIQDWFSSGLISFRIKSPSWITSSS